MANGSVPSRGIRSRLADVAFVARTLTQAGIVAPERPDRSVRALAVLRRWGATPATGYMANAVRSPDRPAIHDEVGTLTFAEVDARTNALAHGFRARGVGPGDGVAILCRNHRGFIEAAIACSKLGANAICMNTGFAGPQIAEVCKREGLAALVYDSEFAETVAEAAASMTCFVAWPGEGATPAEHPAIEDVIARSPSTPHKPPAQNGKIVILTSGTTGLPKGAARQEPSSVAAFAPLFAKIPLRARRTTLIAAPLFHTWGFGHFAFSLTLGSTLVLQRRFDPEQTLAAIERYRPHTLIVVPVMLQRMLDLPPETIRRYDASSLELIAVSGSALPGELALRVMDTFGDVLYNLYGSTEVAWASVASPADMRAAPGTAGTPPRGTVVRLFDENGREVSRGETGRIFVGNEMQFEGYTGGGTKASIDGLMSSGDVGYFDAAGRLFVAGRDDEMIISGGENVFPREVEDLLADHPAVEEAAIIGVEDEKFGQRLRAFVVLRPGEDVTQETLQEYVRENLARFKVPREVVFIDELPRNPAGKVLKRELREREVPAA
jgi:acyl-CoA synthetase (AMP-forming)/AMP-acid ligase II